MEEEKKETKLSKKVEEKKVLENKIATETKQETKKQEAEKKKEKKSTTTENKKVNNYAMIIGIIAVIIAIVAIVLAMSFMKDTPKKVVENTLKNLKEGSYTEQILSGLLEGEVEQNTEAKKLFFQKLEWKVINEKQEGDTATVELEITNKDYKVVMQNCMQKAFKKAITGENVSQEDVINYIMEELKNEEVESITVNQSIQLNKQEGKWKIVEEENFMYAVLPGLQEAMDAFN